MTPLQGTAQLPYGLALKRCPCRDVLEAIPWWLTAFEPGTYRNGMKLRDHFRICPFPLRATDGCPCSLSLTEATHLGWRFSFHALSPLPTSIPSHCDPVVRSFLHSLAVSLNCGAKGCIVSAHDV